MLAEIYLRGLSLAEFFTELDKIGSMVVRRELAILIEQTKNESI